MWVVGAFDSIIDLVRVGNWDGIVITIMNCYYGQVVDKVIKSLLYYYYNDIKNNNYYVLLMFLVHHRPININ